MNFTSIEFLLFFPVVLALHWLLPHRLRKHWLLAASYLFYMYWNPALIVLVLFSTAVDYFCSLGIERSRDNPVVMKLLLLTSVIVNLGLLFTFKYLDLFFRTADTVFAWLSLPCRAPELDLILPVGISFYTFQTMSYTIDVYRGRIRAERDPVTFCLYVSYFPQLVAGPIERPENLLPQLKQERFFRQADFSGGFVLLLRGFFKKIVVADAMAPLVDRVFQNPELALGPEVILGSMLFGIQIYCDFSGYSDIARGCSRFMGVELMENFKDPYSAPTIRDFWRRWHISLTSWFTDYVYIPLGGSRKGLTRQLFNILLVFLLSGLWHGAEWSFVIWGAIHGIYQVCGILWQRFGPKSAMPVWLQKLRTFGLVSFAWIFFRAETVADAAILLSRLNTGWFDGGILGLNLQTAAGVGMILLCLGLLERVPEKPRLSSAQAVTGSFFLLTAIILGWLVILSTNGQNAFIYFQF